METSRITRNEGRTSRHSPGKIRKGREKKEDERGLEIGNSQAPAKIPCQIETGAQARWTLPAPLARYRHANTTFSHFTLRFRDRLPPRPPSVSFPWTIPSSVHFLHFIPFSCHANQRKPRSTRRFFLRFYVSLPALSLSFSQYIHRPVYLQLVVS